MATVDKTAVTEPVTIAFYADSEIKALLVSWAEEEDRSVSNVIRRLVLAEQKRRLLEGQVVVIKSEEAVPAAA